MVCRSENYHSVCETARVPWPLPDGVSSLALLSPLNAASASGRTRGAAVLSLLLLSQTEIVSLLFLSVWSPRLSSMQFQTQKRHWGTEAEPQEKPLTLAWRLRKGTPDSQKQCINSYMLRVFSSMFSHFNSTNK